MKIIILSLLLVCSSCQFTPTPPLDNINPQLNDDNFEDYNPWWKTNKIFTGDCSVRIHN